MNHPYQKIIIIDDNEIDLYVCHSVIAKMHLHPDVSLFTSASGALSHLSGVRVTSGLVLLDLNMPEMDGFEFLTAFERLPTEHTAFIDIVILSSSTHRHDLEKAFCFEAVKNYLVKPLVVSHIEKVLRKVA